jgi:hypothetical protein
MWHVAWDVGSTGPGVNKVRERVIALRPRILALYGERFELYRHASKMGALYANHAVQDRVEQSLKLKLDIKPFGTFDDDLKNAISIIQACVKDDNPPWIRENDKHGELKPSQIEPNGIVDYYTRIMLGVPERLATDDSIKMPKITVSRPAPPTFRYVWYENNPKWPYKEIVHGYAFQVDNLDDLLRAAKLDAANNVRSISKVRIAPLSNRNDGKKTEDKEHDDKYYLIPEGHARYETCKSECAALAQGLGADTENHVPGTQFWAQGPRVEEWCVPRGTIVATFVDGVYTSDYSGRAHVGIFLARDGDGFWILEQWTGGTLRRNKKVFSEKKIGKEGPFRPKLEPLKVRTKVGDRWISDYTRTGFLLATQHRLTENGSEYYVVVSNGDVQRKDDGGKIVPAEDPPTREQLHLDAENQRLV